MSKQQHTPGPWKVVENGFYMQGVKSASGAWLTYKAGQDGMGQKMIEANARLIAAAPELLEALEEALAEIKVMKAEIGFRCITLDVMGKCSAVIAKARGES